MSNILQISNRYHRQLTAELAKVAEFLSFAEELSDGGGSEDCFVLTDAIARASAPEKPAEGASSTSGDGTAADEDNAAQPPETEKRGSLFGGKFGPFASERNVGAAVASLASELSRH